ncbi:MAG: FAD-binding protein [Thermomicrobium sp.]|uniref:FAD-linked oxidase C-terminal domain-containing protein n=1 Tax=Thermomicrobium sp. TaxID=1969469 RepID=UPI001B2449EA|nr:FAD-linked oxidase C-terminal domain-containing protein [Thermomicrobium sp.]MBO9359131.1 FAD-binding protein [Thermomicrobium sp.]
MDRATIRSRLVEIVGSDGVLDDPEELLVYEFDASDEVFAGHHRPDFAVLPRTAEQVSAVVRLANEFGIPVVARGAGTGLAGGALALRGGIVVVVTRMNRILEVNEQDGYAIVEPGVINLELTQALQPRGYFFAPDPASQRACTIGGNVGNNSGGPHCLKYGVTTNHILGLEVVLPDGERIWTGGPVPETPGVDLTGVLVGSEGTLGIVTKVMVRLTRLPEAVSVLLAAFPDIESASHATSAIIAAGMLPAALEMMDQLTIKAVEDAFHAGYPREAGAVLLVELDGLQEIVAENTSRVAELCRQHGAWEVRVARTKEERDLLWLGRKSAFGAMGRLAPNYYLVDTTVPRTKLPATMRRVEELSREYRLSIANVFHAGDGNLHPLVLFDRQRPGEVERVLECTTEILRYCVDAGGTLSGEHGIGFEKRDYMTLVFTTEDLCAMAGLKRSFDPRELFNPEKVLPTGFRCGEVAALRQQAIAQRLGLEYV